MNDGNNRAMTEPKPEDLEAALYIHDTALALAKLAAASKFQRLTYLLSLAATEAADRAADGAAPPRRSP